MPDEPPKYPPSVQAQIDKAGQNLTKNEVKLEGTVSPESGPPTDWTKKPGVDKVPEPQHIEPPAPEQPEQPTPEH